MLFKSRKIRVDESGLVCLSDIHSAAGFSKNQTPSDYMALPSSQKEVVALVGKKTGKSGLFGKTEIKSVWYSKKGPGGGVWADENIALGYAAYLSPTLAVEIRDVFLRFKKGDESLVDEIRENGAKRDAVREQHRQIGKKVRKDYTDTLKSHGVTKWYEYAHCTNETYKHLLGGTAKELRISRKLAPKANVRDHMSLAEIAYTMASEALAVERIEDQNANGYAECKTETRIAATTIRGAIEHDRRNRQQRLV
ncbi:hypothetical protein AKG11_03675 [Shinella sp. SUS2]|uniref:KilA-N domain-containing protein n=1 Tax=unclassified Shinella TaxID=2643062 RepID=UPI0006809EC6|nr:MULTISPECIES: KilA-N domain-containing protein [unclassified Shinella]KNY18243.1 hypothetical protein AKG11_03675 [Shinella sp. SUS2]KOC77438.1 hypothetical protein AKG10_01145 [Shinella sp. GWS1]